MAGDACPVEGLSRIYFIAPLVCRVLRIPVCAMTGGAFLELFRLGHLLDRVVACDAGDTGSLFMRKGWIGIYDGFMAAMIKEHKPPGACSVESNNDSLSCRPSLVWGACTSEQRQ